MKYISQTKISANITESGLELFIHSPEIGKAIESGSFLTYIWKNQEQVSAHFLSSSFPFSELVKYFATPPDMRSDYAKNFQFNFLDLFNYLHQKFPKVTLTDRIWMDRGTNLFNQRSLNIFPLTDTAIKKGKRFNFKGVYSPKLVKEQILLPYRGYAEAFIRTFGSNEINN